MAAATRMAESLATDREARNAEFGALASLRRKIAEGVAARLAVGCVPPGPATLRAKIGGFLISRIRRMLFWLLPQLDRFHAAVLEIEQQQIKISEDLAGEQQTSAARLRALEEQVRRLQAYERTLREMESGTRVVREAVRNLEERILSQEEELPAQWEQLRAQILHAAGLPGRTTASMDCQMPRQALEALIAVLKDHSPGVSHMPVLDIASGSGEWLEVLESAGFAAQGVEENFVLAAAGACKGLRLVAADPLAYLNSLPSACMGAITSLNAIDRLSLPQCIMLLDESARVLMPGGIALFATFDSSFARAYRTGAPHENGAGAHKPADTLGALAQLRGFDDAKLVRFSDNSVAPLGPAGLSLRDELATGGLYLVCVKTQPVTGDNGSS